MLLRMKIGRKIPKGLSRAALLHTILADVLNVDVKDHAHDRNISMLSKITTLRLALNSDITSIIIQFNRLGHFVVIVGNFLSTTGMRT